MFVYFKFKHNWVPIDAATLLHKLTDDRSLAAPDCDSLKKRRVNHHGPGLLIWKSVNAMRHMRAEPSSLS